MTVLPSLKSRSLKTLPNSAHTFPSLQRRKKSDLSSPLIRTMPVSLIMGSLPFMMTATPPLLLFTSPNPFLLSTQFLFPRSSTTIRHFTINSLSMTRMAERIGQVSEHSSWFSPVFSSMWRIDEKTALDARSCVHMHARDDRHPGVQCWPIKGRQSFAPLSKRGAKDNPCGTNGQAHLHHSLFEGISPLRWEMRGCWGGWAGPPGQVWADYTHEVDELFMVLEGDVELEMRGGRMRLKGGEEVLIPA